MNPIGWIVRGIRDEWNATINQLPGSAARPTAVQIDQTKGFLRQEGKVINDFLKSATVHEEIPEKVEGLIDSLHRKARRLEGMEKRALRKGNTTEADGLGDEHGKIDEVIDKLEHLPDNFVERALWRLGQDLNKFNGFDETIKKDKKRDINRLYAPRDPSDEELIAELKSREAGISAKDFIEGLKTQYVNTCVRLGVSAKNKDWLNKLTAELKNPDPDASISAKDFKKGLCAQYEATCALLKVSPRDQGWLGERFRLRVEFAEVQLFFQNFEQGRDATLGKHTIPGSVSSALGAPLALDEDDDEYERITLDTSTQTQDANADLLEIENDAVRDRRKKTPANNPDTDTDFFELEIDAEQERREKAQEMLDDPRMQALPHGELVREYLENVIDHPRSEAATFYFEMILEAYTALTAKPQQPISFTLPDEDGNPVIFASGYDPEIQELKNLKKNTLQYLLKLSKNQEGLKEGTTPEDATQFYSTMEKVEVNIDQVITVMQERKLDIPNRSEKGKLRGYLSSLKDSLEALELGISDISIPMHPKGSLVIKDNPIAEMRMAEKAEDDSSGELKETFLKSDTTNNLQAQIASLIDGIPGICNLRFSTTRTVDNKKVEKPVHTLFGQFPASEVAYRIGDGTQDVEFTAGRNTGAKFDHTTGSPPKLLELQRKLIDAGRKASKDFDTTEVILIARDADNPSDSHILVKFFDRFANDPQGRGSRSNVAFSFANPAHAEKVAELIQQPGGFEAFLRAVDPTGGIIQHVGIRDKYDFSVLRTTLDSESNFS